MNTKKKTYIGVGFAILGILLMAIGVIKEDNADILSKAIRICLECIGIG